MIAGCEHLCCIVCAVRCTQEQGCCPICRRSADVSRTDDTVHLQSDFIDVDSDVSLDDALDDNIQMLHRDLDDIRMLLDVLSSQWRGPENDRDPDPANRDPMALGLARAVRAATPSAALVPGMLEADTKRLRKAVGLVFSGLSFSLASRRGAGLLSRRASEPASESSIPAPESPAPSRLRSQSV